MKDARHIDPQTTQTNPVAMPLSEPLEVDPDLKEKLSSLSEQIAAGVVLTREDRAFLDRVSKLVGQPVPDPARVPVEYVERLLSEWRRGSKLATRALGRCYEAEDSGDIALAITILDEACSDLGLPFFEDMFRAEQARIRSANAVE